MKRIAAFSFCVIVAVASLHLAARGDILITKGGSRYKGTVTEKDDAYVLTKPAGGRITFPKSMVRKVIKEKTPPPKPSETKPAPAKNKPKDAGKPPATPKPPAAPKPPPEPVLKEGKVPREKRTVFAVGFDNATGQEQYDPAAAGLGDMVAVLLGQQESIAVVERQRLAVLTAEQARSLKGITGAGYALRAGKLMEADTVLTGRLFLVQDKLTVNVKAIDIERELIIASDQISCRPTYLMEAALQLARKLGEQMALPLPEIDLKKIDKSPIASLHFAKALSHYYAGNMDAAIMQFMRSIDIDPNYYEAHYFSGLCYHRLGEDAHAIIEWEKFLKADPGSPYAPLAKDLLAKAKQRVKDSPVPRLGPPTTGPAPRPQARKAGER